MTERLRTRLSDERGIALVVSLSVLLITVLLAGAAASIAIDTNSLSNRDTNTKAALEAADAGARAAVYRLNVYKPGPNNCPTVPTAAAVGGAGAPNSNVCAADGPEQLGNGSSFQYWISRAMQPGDTCVGPTVSSNTSDVAQRCVTAVGTSNGVTERLQERIAAYTSTPVFPAAIFGTKAVTINNNVSIVSDTVGSPALLGTNGTLTVGGTGGGNTTIDGFQIPCSATKQVGQNVTDLGPENSCAAPYPIPTPVNPGTTAQNTASPFDLGTTYQQGTCAQPASWTGVWVQTNCNYRITRGLTYTGCINLGQPVVDCDPYQAHKASDIAFDPTNRTLYLNNNATLWLGGGYYNFCSLYLSNNAQILLSPGAKVSIFIDSPSDPNSGAPVNPPLGSATNPKCPSTNSAQGVAPGTLTMSQNSAINPGGTALNAQIYVFGDTTNNPPTNTVSLQNNGTSSFALVAPFSNVVLNPSNKTTFRGAIVGYTVSIGNAAHFTYEADSSTLQSGSLENYYRSFWQQCSQVTSSGDPTGSC